MISLVCLSVVWGFGYIVYLDYRSKHDASAADIAGVASMDGEMTDLDLDDHPSAKEKRKSIEADTTMEDVSVDRDFNDEKKEEDDVDVNKGEMA